jgi:hypothetical protein
MLVNPKDRAQTAVLAGQYVELAKSAMAPHPQSPAGAALLGAYNRWRAQQAGEELSTAVKASAIAMTITADERKRIQKKAAKKAAKKIKRAREAAALAGPALEERAVDRSVRRMQIALTSGRSTAAALAAGFECYTMEGGKLGLAAWKRKIVT